MHCTYQDERSLSGPATIDLTKQVLARGIPFRFCARGRSMLPFIHDGDVISLAPLRGQPRLGEVVAFIRPGSQRLVVHRVVGRTGAACLIQGDNCAGYPDGWVPVSALLGAVSHVERSGRCNRLGLGPEGILVAILSRLGWLQRLVRLALKLHNVLHR